MEVSRVGSICVYLTLAAICITLVVQGPITTALKKGDTTYREIYEAIQDLKEPLEWPSVVICKLPLAKKPITYYEFMQKGRNKAFQSQEEFDTLASEIFHTRPEDIILGATVAMHDHHEALERKRRIKIAAPYVTPMIGDFVYFGYCASISLQAFRGILVQEGETLEGDIDSDFIAIIWLKVLDHEENGRFWMTFLSENDDKILGSDSSITHSKILTIPNSVGKVMRLTFGKRRRIRSCDPSAKLMTPCLTKRFKDLHGNGFNDLVQMYDNLSLQRFSGAEAIFKVSGCLPPCESTTFYLNEFSEIPRDEIRDVALLGEMKDNRSSVLTISHIKRDKIKALEEIPLYTTATFISDVGGIMGIFLGLSFWSIHEALIAPLLVKLDNLLQK